MPPFKKPHHTSEIDKVTGSKDSGYVILPRGLNIVWGNDPRYWKIPNDGNAELIQVSWLEVSGSVKVTKKKYRVSFDVKLKADSFGWNGTQVLVMAKVGKKGTYSYKEVTLSGTPGQILTIPDLSNALTIAVEQNAPEVDLHFGLYEVWSGKWKGGLEIVKARVDVVP